MLSKCHQPTMVNIANRREGEPVVQKSYAVKQYNLHMGGVDNVDQQLHNVRILRKTYKCIEACTETYIASSLECTPSICKNTWIERCYFSKVYAGYDCSYFTIVPKVE